MVLFIHRFLELLSFRKVPHALAFEDYRILFDRARGDVLYDVLVYSFNGDGFPETAVADSGLVAFDDAQDEALLYLFDGEMHRIDPDDPGVYALTTFAYSIETSGQNYHVVRTRSVTMDQFQDEVATKCSITNPGTKR